MKRSGTWWKRGGTVASCTLLLLFILYVPIVSAASYEQTEAQAGVQGTPTVDPTVTALQKQQLSLEVDQLQHNFGNYLWNNLTLLLSTVILAVGGTIGFWRWLVERQSEAEKRSEEAEKRSEERFQEEEKFLDERFQEVIEGARGKELGRQVAGAIILRRFLQPRYQRFSQQVFELAVANLQIHRKMSQQEIDHESKMEQPNVIDKTLVTIFQKTFPSARAQLGDKFKPEELSASGIGLENANLVEADLKYIFMQDANLRGANLRRADFDGADLSNAKIFKINLFEAKLTGTIMLSVKGISKDLRKDCNDRGAKIGGNSDFSGVNFREANLSEANLREASFNEAIFHETDLSGAILNNLNEDFNWANIEGADYHPEVGKTYRDLSRENFSRADLSGADFSRADFSRANFKGTDLSGADFKGAKMYGAKGLTNEQKQDLEQRGANFDPPPVNKP